MAYLRIAQVSGNVETRLGPLGNFYKAATPKLAPSKSSSFPETFCNAQVNSPLRGGLCRFGGNVGKRHTHRTDIAP